jgi:hypothetical protein
MINDMNTNDLDWQALCYAAGELDAAAAERFEAQLADHQHVREALARAVELTQTIAAAETQSAQCVSVAKNTGVAWNSRFSWMAVGCVAAVLVAMLWSGVVDPTWRTALRQWNAGAQYSLAMAWQQAASEIDNVKASGLWPSAAIDDEDERQSELHLVSYENGEDAWLDEAPSWMMAAVYGAAEESRDPASTIQ